MVCTQLVTEVTTDTKEKLQQNLLEGFHKRAETRRAGFQLTGMRRRYLTGEWKPSHCIHFCTVQSVHKLRLRGREIPGMGLAWQINQCRQSKR